jgi:hypothetical protein
VRLFRGFLIFHNESGQGNDAKTTWSILKLSVKILRIAFCDFYDELFVFECGANRVALAYGVVRSYIDALSVTAIRASVVVAVCHIAVYYVAVVMLVGVLFALAVIALVIHFLHPAFNFYTELYSAQ